MFDWAADAAAKGVDWVIYLSDNDVEEFSICASMANESNNFSGIWQVGADSTGWR